MSVEKLCVNRCGSTGRSELDWKCEDCFRNQTKSPGSVKKEAELQNFASDLQLTKKKVDFRVTIQQTDQRIDIDPKFLQLLYLGSTGKPFGIGYYGGVMYDEAFDDEDIKQIAIVIRDGFSGVRSTPLAVAVSATYQHEDTVIPWHPLFEFDDGSKKGSLQNMNHERDANSVFVRITKRGDDIFLQDYTWLGSRLGPIDNIIIVIPIHFLKLEFSEYLMKRNVLSVHVED